MPSSRRPYSVILLRWLGAWTLHTVMLGAGWLGKLPRRPKPHLIIGWDKPSVKRLLILPKSIAPAFFPPIILGVLGETINATQVVKACLMSRPAVSRQWELSLCSNYCGRFPMSTKASGSHFESDLVSHSAITASIIAFLSHT